MLYVLLKVISATGLAMALKYVDRRGIDRLPVIRINYAVAALLAFFVALATNQTALSRPTALLAIITGGLFVSGILVLVKTISVAGVARAVVAMRTAVVIPMLASVLIWHERPGTPGFVGAAVALAAIGLIISDVRPAPGKTNAAGSPALWLAALFLIDGLVMVPAKIFQQQLPPAETFPFQVVIFITGFFITTAIYYLRRPRVTPDSLRLGALVGASNLGNYLFLVMALASLPGTVVYPVMAAGEVGLAALAGALVWGERVGPRSWTGIALAVIALILMNLR